MNLWLLRGIVTVSAIVMCNGAVCAKTVTNKDKQMAEIQKLDLIPQPQQVQISGKGFQPRQAQAISVADTPDSRFAARLLRQALRESHGIDCDILLQPASHAQPNGLTLSASDAAVSPPLTPSENRAECYALRVSQAGAVIAGSDSAGLFYGVQTLIQLIEQSEREKREIPGMLLNDWPTFGLRSSYIDSDQFKGSIRVTRGNIESMIKQMSKFKMNYMVIEMYNLMPFKSFPYCADEDTLSIADWNYLVELAHRYHVVIMPSLQSFAQMYDVLWPCEEGKPYREGDSAWPGIICPSRPENMELLKGLYKDLMTVFKYSPYFGIGCSEVGMGWKEFCPLCQKRLDNGETLNDIFGTHVRDCVQAVKSAAKELNREIRPWMWADEFYMAYSHRGGNNFEGMELIDKDVVMCHWAYWSKIWSKPSIGNYEGIKGLLERGYDVSFASASYIYNNYLLDLSPGEPGETTMDFNDTSKKFFLTIDSGIQNIAEQSKWAETYQRQVPANKLIGGACATFSQHDIKCWDTTWYAYALHADYTWGDPSRSVMDYRERFSYKFAAAFYGARDKKTAQTIADAYLKLDAVKTEIEQNNYLIRDVMGEYDIQDNAYIDNTLDKSLVLIRELTSNPKGPGKTIADVRTRAEHVKSVASSVRAGLAKLAPKLRNSYSWSYLLTVARKMENHATRTTYMLDQEQTLQTPTTWDAGRIDKLIARLTALRNETRVIADEMNELTWGRGVSAAPWSPSGDTTGYMATLGMLDQFALKLADVRREGIGPE